MTEGGSIRQDRGVRLGVLPGLGGARPPIPYFFAFFGFGAGSSRVVILTNSLNHSASSI